MFRPSDHSGTHIQKHDLVLKQDDDDARYDYVRSVTLAGYLLMVNTRWGQMADIAAYSEGISLAPLSATMTI
jgi:hypothetical protein